MSMPFEWPSVLQFLRQLTCFDHIKSDRNGQRCGNKVMAKHSTVKPRDHDEFCLSVVCGEYPNDLPRLRMAAIPLGTSSRAQDK
jgi:hypothetical protein